MSRSAMSLIRPAAFAAKPDERAEPVTRVEASVRPGERWHPGLGGVCHNELFAASGEAAGVGAALALALDDWRSTSAQADGKDDSRAVLWVQTSGAARLSGRPYRPGLPAELRHRLIYVLARKPEDALFALEEGMRCREIAFVIGEVEGNPRALDFTASRRLTLTAERHKVPLYLVRLDAQRDLSSARMRWDVASVVSPLPRWNAQAPGSPAWRAELFRSRGHAPGKWMLRQDGDKLVAARSFDHLEERDAATFQPPRKFLRAFN